MGKLRIFGLLSLFIIFTFYLSTNKKSEIIASESSISETKIISLINIERSKNNLPNYRINYLLTKASNLKSNDMFKHDYWSHISPKGVTPWMIIRKTGYRYTHAGENLAEGYQNSRDVINGWMNSELHKNNILSDKFTEIGVSVKKGKIHGLETILVVAEFGDR